MSIVGASLEESVGVHCRVNADPADVEFEWIFSNSNERIESQHGQYNIEANGASGFIGKFNGSEFYSMPLITTAIIMIRE